MGIYIKDMEMPKPKLVDMATVYNAYILVSPNGHAAIVVNNEDGLNSTEYPLVSVPPHGRLIDADALKKQMSDYAESYGWWFVLCNAPTIIPASEEGE